MTEYDIERIGNNNATYTYIVISFFPFSFGSIYVTEINSTFHIRVGMSNKQTNKHTINLDWVGRKLGFSVKMETSRRRSNNFLHEFKQHYIVVEGTLGKY